MKFDLETFLWIGITLAVFNRVGKVSVVEERLNKSSNCSEMLFLSIFKTLLGILYGPVDLLISREERINFNFFIVRICTGTSLVMLVTNTVM